MNTHAAIDTPPPLQDMIARLRRLARDDRHGDVLDAVDTALAAAPDHRDLLLIKAISERHARRIDDALATLDRLDAVQPDFSLMHQERGLCHVARKDAPHALEALLRAVAINPALPMSWRMLVGVYRIVGDAENASVAETHVATLAALPPPIVAATALFADGDLAEAEAMIRAWLLRHGDHPEAMRLLAKIGMASDVLDDAETLLEAVVRMLPDHRAARQDYVQCLVQRHKYAEARGEIERLLALDTDNLDYRSLAATIAVGLGEHERAIDLYRTMLAAAPASPDLHLWLGHALKTVGRADDAIASYRAAAAARPDFGDAYWSLANLKTYRFADDEIDRMHVEEARAPAMEDRIHLCFALGKALEDRGDVDGAWQHYERGNALKCAGSRYRPEVIETNTSEQVRVCTRAFFAARAGCGNPSYEPIFILGLPRSGSTLIEQILASHSEVEGTQELPDIQRTVLGLQDRVPDFDRPRYPGILADLTAEDVRCLGDAYLASTQVYRSGKRFFIDKMPNNFRHIGLIHLMLPNARIIDARREPMACCFSNLKQLFANGQEFTYSVEFIARYYRTYLDLMRHWDNALPGRVLRIQHEGLVADLEGNVHRILDYVGLPFEKACINFHQNRRSVRTPSSEQVRQPIFRDSLDQWRKFASVLEPLQESLADAVTDYRR